jgi:hypothetical protein
MKFLVPNYSCFQNPWRGGYVPRSPFSLFSVLNWICWTPPPPKKIPGYATDQNLSQKVETMVIYGRSRKGQNSEHQGSTVFIILLLVYQYRLSLLVVWAVSFIKHDTTSCAVAVELFCGAVRCIKCGFKLRTRKILNLFLPVLHDACLQIFVCSWWWHSGFWKQGIWSRSPQ